MAQLASIYSICIAFNCCYLPLTFSPARGSQECQYAGQMRTRFENENENERRKRKRKTKKKKTLYTYVKQILSIGR